ncbi:hypothetical protein A1O3_04280 [Capronia epimyces CBS 606.96]|uniref:Uncharacterized protein n=1 Tax=Capronia epimyces CBS 606.96 TaxID=1182542 RepID=W9YDI7_9EURO|nr:uncharacterized protein A1O3_04280 [Capronia epimyces CBS 606.96]EXJ87321.1 hypothetical protein A1O3_04280 [Capronia epimyces CBS 606.96]
MSAIPFAFQNMNPSHLDDKMDVASSPFLQPDDFDVELDSIREPSIIESLHDDMVDDAVQPAEVGSDIMQDQLEETLPDDDMVDDENATNPPVPRDEDFNMDAFADEPRVDEDEDILYEEEEDIEHAIEQVEESLEFKSQQEPPQYQELEPEVILDDTEEQPDEQDPHHLDTNEPEADTRTDAQVNLEDAEQESANAGFTSTESSAEALVQPKAQDGGDDSLEQELTTQENHTGSSIEFLQEVQVVESYVESENVEQVPEHTETAEMAETPVLQERDKAVTELQLHVAEGLSGSQKDSVKAVHPVTLLYLDEEMSLFPPMIGDESSVYFLADSSLVFEPLDKLLAACRDILTGTLDHHDELVLDITSLGLHICEDSKYAAQITLSQILDVYLQLCRNDEGQEIHPLYCHLSSRVSLASQYSYLVSSSHEGRTFSEIAADHIDTPEAEDEHANAAHYRDDQQGDSNQEAPIEEHSNENVSNEQPTTLEAEVDHQFDVAAPEGEDVEWTVANSPGQAFDTAVSEEAPQGSVEQLDRSEPSPTQKPEQAATDDKAHALDEEEQPFQADGSEHEAYLDIADHFEAQEYETNSSHTVEAEQAENETLEGVEDAFGVEKHDSFDDSFEQVEDLFEHDNGAEQADGEDLGPYSDEEIFVQEAGVQDEANNVVLPLEPEAKSPTLQISDEHNQSSEDPFHPADNDAQSASHGHDATSATIPEPPSLASPPVTPSKANHAKRKVDDDDELDLLDLDTPDPKRRRPS